MVLSNTNSSTTTSSPVTELESSEYGNPIHSQNDVLIMLPIAILKI